MKKIAVVLLNLGGPNNEDAVQPFLYNLFMDPDIIKIPLKGKWRERLVNWYSKKRASKVVKKYAEVNACPTGCLGPKSCSNRLNKTVSACCSPINPLTERQRSALQKFLNQNGSGHTYKVYTAMRYWKPDTRETLNQIIQDDCDEVVLLPLYPHFSYTSSGSSFNEWTKEIMAQGLQNRWKTHMIISYHLHPGYIAAINRRIDERLTAFPLEKRDSVHLLFSAHGTPVSEKESGDPYSHQIRETIAAVMKARGNDLPHWLSFQSRVGPVKWLEPNTEKFIPKLQAYGVNNLLVVPIAFVSDHLETVHEIGIEFREIAEDIGLEGFHFTEGLNDHPLFIEAMAGLVQEKLFHSPVQDNSKAAIFTQTPT